MTGVDPRPSPKTWESTLTDSELFLTGWDPDDQLLKIGRLLQNDWAWCWFFFCFFLGQQFIMRGSIAVRGAGYKLGYYCNYASPHPYPTQVLVLATLGGQCHRRWPLSQERQ
ncbi:hypothetical protein L208DRAFT_670949 [Tricholoma matsutake]|nr:hypothetical protein L208DRAFT_670949 [Tricholoma matsutake 945]